MKYTLPPSSLFTRNRAKLTKHLPAGSIAILHANDIQPTNADGSRPFKQNSDIFYLTGIDQEETILVLCPDAYKLEHREMVFVKKTSDLIAIWEGAKLSKEEATQVSGIKSIYWIEEYDSILKQVVFQVDTLFLNTNEHLRSSNPVESRDDRFRKQYQAQFPLHTFKRIAPILQYIRSIKEVEEIQMLQEACRITGLAFNRVLKFVQDGVWEYEIEAEIQHEFLRNKSRGPAYEMIIGSGYSACVLHYIENSKQCKNGDVILMDFGAEYGNYCSDLSRSIPVSGKFTERQKTLYNAVLRVHRAAAKLLIPGKYLDVYHQEVGLLMQEELLSLGLITKEEVQKQNPAWPAFKQYFMHGTSHFLGLDVHDVGIWHKPIEAGMVFTVEPGIYIPKENLGIRLENDIVITDSGFIDLMAHIPIEADEIEDIMQSK